MQTKNSPSVFGGALLVTGSCVGAGMLGLPIMTGLVGFFPSLILFFIAAIFMTFTALLLVEVQQEFSQPVNLSTMCGFSLGKVGRFLCWVTYLFLFYALLVAYTALSGHHTSLLLEHFLSVNLPEWVGSLFFVILFGAVVYRGTTPVDLLNRFFMVFKILAYFGLIFVGSRFIDTNLYSRVSWNYLLPAIPIMIISFGFHNMVPSLVKHFGNDSRKVVLSILWGVLMTVVVNLVWQWVALGSIPVGGKDGLMDSYQKGVDAAQSMSMVLSTPSVSLFSNALAFFAIMTSFLAQSMSLVHFLQDATQVKVKEGQESFSITCLALLPPLLIAILGPNLFFSALNFAGGICTMLLFGVLPVWMCWIKRYQRGHRSGFMAPGGRVVFIVLFLFALFVMVYQLSSMMGVIGGN
ncbi:MAG: tyrosine transporter [Chlamydiae bacterium]|nr:tyrosine transporter [Chlamydiota bacterium]